MSEPIELIVGNSNKRFSGVTSTMLQVLPSQSEQMELAVLGRHHLPSGVPRITFWQAARLCRRPLGDGRPRVFHARRNNEMIQALLLKRVFGAKLRIVFTSTAQRHHTRFTRWLMRQMDGIITTCTAAGSYLRRPADIVVPHGVDQTTYRPVADKAAAWRALGIDGAYGIGIFGRVRRQKGLDLLVDAAIPLLQQDPDPTLVIVGETTPRHTAYLDEQLAKLRRAGLEHRVAVLGKRPFSEIPQLFRAMSLVVALSRNEGFGLTVLEAMASGTAVLASEAGAWRDVVRDGVDGRVVPCDNVDATRAALADLIQDADQLLTMGREGRRRVEQEYTIEREAEALCQFYRQVAART